MKVVLNSLKEVKEFVKNQKIRRKRRAKRRATKKQTQFSLPSGNASGGLTSWSNNDNLQNTIALQTLKELQNQSQNNQTNFGRIEDFTRHYVTLFRDAYIKPNLENIINQGNNELMGLDNKIKRLEEGLNLYTDQNLEFVSTKQKEPASDEVTYDYDIDENVKEEENPMISQGESNLFATPEPKSKPIDDEENNNNPIKVKSKGVHEAKREELKNQYRALGGTDEKILDSPKIPPQDIRYAIEQLKKREELKNQYRLLGGTDEDILNSPQIPLKDIRYAIEQLKKKGKSENVKTYFSMKV